MMYMTKKKRRGFSMKRKALLIGASLTLALPLFAYASGADNGTKTNEQLPKVAIDNTQTANNSFRWNEQCDGTGPQGKTQFGQGRQMMGPYQSEQRQIKEKELLGLVKQYAPDQVNEWEKVIKERTTLHEQLFAQRSQSNNQWQGQGQGQGKRRGQGMMNGGPAFNDQANMQGEQRYYCQDLDKAIAAGNKEEINKQLNVMLDHYKERNEWLQSRINEIK